MTIEEFRSKLIGEYCGNPSQLQETHIPGKRLSVFETGDSNYARFWLFDEDTGNVVYRSETNF